MPKVSGLSSKGLKAKDFLAIKDELEADLRKEVDPTLHFGAGSIAGVLTAIIANQVKQVWEVAYGLYHSLQPSTATGRALDELCSLTGTYRRMAAYSRAKATVTLNANTTIPKDSRIQTIGGHFFKVTAEVKNDSSRRRDIEIDVIAEKTGPITAHNGTEAKIMTPTAGWSKTVIKHTYEVGQLDETDDDLRRRRITELKANGSSTTASINSRLMQIRHVEAVYVKESTRSFEVIIKGGNDDEIAQAIWQCKPLGIETSGSVSQTVTDTLGQSRTIRFSRPETIAFALNMNIKTKHQLDQNEIDSIKNALVDFAVRHFTLGAEIYPSRFYNIALNQPNVLDVTNLQLQQKSFGRYALSEIAPHQIASLSFTDITIQQSIEVVR